MYWIADTESKNITFVHICNIFGYFLVSIVLDSVVISNAEISLHESQFL